jgi:hypothetical protein
MDFGQRIDKEEVLETDAMIAVGRLWRRTLDLEEKLRGNPQPLRRYYERRYLERLHGQVNSAAHYLRDWGFNAKADEMLSVWGDFYGAWTQPTADVSGLPGLAGNFNRWLRVTLERLLKVDDQPPAAGIPAADEPPVEETKPVPPAGFGWLTAQELADFVGVDAKTAYNWITGRTGKLTVVDAQGNSYLLNLAELTAKREAQTAAKARKAAKAK